MENIKQHYTQQDRNTIAQELIDAHERGDTDTALKLSIALKSSELNVVSDEGVDSGWFRAGFSRMDSDEERVNYLNENVGSGLWNKDAETGEFTLTPDGMRMVGATVPDEWMDTKIEDEGLSWYDLADWGGEAPAIISSMVPVLAGKTPQSTAGAVLLEGLAASTGKAVDELVEYFQGYQRQSKADIAKDVGVEFALGGAGEATVRGGGAEYRWGKQKAKDIGGVFKPAATSLSPETKELVSELLDEGMIPNIYPATEGKGKILGHLQAIFHKVAGDPHAETKIQWIENSINELIAQTGGRGTIKDADGRIVLDEISDVELGELIRKRVGGWVAKQKSQVTQSQKTLDQQIRQISQGLRTRYGKAQPIAVAGEGLRRELDDAYQAFSGTVTSMYSRFDQLTGNAPVVPTQNLKAAYNQILGSYPEGIGKSAMQKQAGGGSVLDVGNMPDYVTATQYDNYRKIVGDIANSDDYLKSVKNYIGSSFKRAIDADFDSVNIAMIRTSQSKILDESGKPFRFSQILNTSEEKAAIDMLKQARQFYSDNITKFDNAVIQRVLKDTKLAGSLTDHEIVNHVIKSGKPDNISAIIDAVPADRKAGLTQLLRASWMEDVMAKYADPINADKVDFGRVLGEMNKNFAVLEKVYGKKEAATLRSSMRALSLSGKRVPYKELSEVTNDPTGLVSLLKEHSKIAEKYDSIMGNDPLALFQGAFATGDVRDRMAARVAKEIGNVEPDEVVGMFLSGRRSSLTKLREIKALVGEDSAEWAAMRNKAMERVLSSIRGDGTAYQGQLLLDAISGQSKESYSVKALKEIFGSDVYANMMRFGKKARLLTEQAKGGSLVADSISAAPVKNLGKIAKISALGQALSDKRVVKFFSDAVDAGVDTPEGVQHWIQYTKALGEIAERTASVGSRLGAQTVLRAEGAEVERGEIEEQ